MFHAFLLFKSEFVCFDTVALIAHRQWILTTRFSSVPIIITALQELLNCGSQQNSLSSGFLFSTPFLLIKSTCFDILYYFEAKKDLGAGVIGCKVFIRYLFILFCYSVVRRRCRLEKIFCIGTALDVSWDKIDSQIVMMTASFGRRS